MNDRPYYRLSVCFIIQSIDTPYKHSIYKSHMTIMYRTHNKILYYIL